MPALNQLGDRDAEKVKILRGEELSLSKKLMPVLFDEPITKELLVDILDNRPFPLLCDEENIPTITSSFPLEAETGYAIDLSVSHPEAVRYLFVNGHSTSFEKRENKIRFWVTEDFSPGANKVTVTNCRLEGQGIAFFENRYDPQIGSDVHNFTKKGLISRREMIVPIPHLTEGETLDLYFPVLNAGAVKAELIGDRLQELSVTFVPHRSVPLSRFRPKATTDRSTGGLPRKTYEWTVPSSERSSNGNASRDYHLKVQCVADCQSDTPEPTDHEHYFHRASLRLEWPWPYSVEAARAVTSFPISVLTASGVVNSQAVVGPPRLGDPWVEEGSDHAVSFAEIEGGGFFTVEMSRPIVYREGQFDFFVNELGEGENRRGVDNINRAGDDGGPFANEAYRVSVSTDGRSWTELPRTPSYESTGDVYFKVPSQPEAGFRYVKISNPGEHGVEIVTISGLDPSVRNNRIWKKGQIHLHSLRGNLGNESMHPLQLVKRYRSVGYDFINLSEHNIRATRYYENDRRYQAWNDGDIRWYRDDSGENYQNAYDRFLLIKGEEVTRGIAHLIAFNTRETIGIPSSRTGGNIIGLIRDIQGVGGIPILNHPYWGGSDNRHGEGIIDASTIAELYQQAGLRHVETYNDGGRAVPGSLWDELLSRGIRIFGVGSDDAHQMLWLDPDLRSGGSGHQMEKGFIVVAAKDLTEEAIRRNFEEGHFYPSSGVYLDAYTINERGEGLRLELISPQETVFVEPRGLGADNADQFFFLGQHGKIREVHVGRKFAKLRTPSAEWKQRGDNYIRVWVRNDRGETASTQPLFLP
ncbi:MAG: hypothetical protein Q7S98_05090 [Deltaproteobacteria bacterium]|nr:hypothetical protein [Deltaproteobacteria bacterium]